MALDKARHVLEIHERERERESVFCGVGGSRGAVEGEAS